MSNERKEEKNAKEIPHHLQQESHNISSRIDKSMFHWAKKGMWSRVVEERKKDAQRDKVFAFVAVCLCSCCYYEFAPERMDGLKAWNISLCRYVCYFFVSPSLGLLRAWMIPFWFTNVWFESWFTMNFCLFVPLSVPPTLKSVPDAVNPFFRALSLLARTHIESVTDESTYTFTEFIQFFSFSTHLTLHLFVSSFCSIFFSFSQFITYKLNHPSLSSINSTKRKPFESSHFASLRSASQESVRDESMGRWTRWNFSA